MKILLDESVPHIVQTKLSHLAIRTVQDMGWTGTKNGELLRRVELFVRLMPVQWRLEAEKFIGKEEWEAMGSSPR